MQLAVIAGRGDLPKHVASAARSEGLLKTIVALEGFAEEKHFEAAKTLRVGEFGGIIKHLKKHKVTHVCFCGNVERPDFKSVRPDLKAMLYLPGTIKAAQKGDDALLRHLMGLFEKEGLKVVSPQEICKPLLLAEGPLGAVTISEAHRDDTISACHIAQSIGALDIGQAAVVARGVTLAVEAQEGTDAMLTRIMALPSALRGTEEAPSGVLAKMVKPIQDTRIDMPVIGLDTIKNVADAGLAGIVAEAGGAFILDREAVIEFADQKGLFIMGLPPSHND